MVETHFEDTYLITVLNECDHDPSFCCVGFHCNPWVPCFLFSWVLVFDSCFISSVSVCCVLSICDYLLCCVLCIWVLSTPSSLSVVLCIWYLCVFSALQLFFFNLLLVFWLNLLLDFFRVSVFWVCLRLGPLSTEPYITWRKQTTCYSNCMLCNIYADLLVGEKNV